MANLKVNFADVEEFSLVPEGNYLVEVEEVEMRESKSSEFPYLNWKLRIVEDLRDDAEDPDEFVGRTLYTMTSLHPGALWRTKETFVNIGIYEEDLDFEVDDDTNMVTEPELVGIQAIAPVYHEEYENRMRPRVETLLPADEEPEEPEPEEEEEAPKPKAKPTGKKAASASRGGGKKPAAKRRTFK